MTSTEAHTIEAQPVLHDGIRLDALLHRPRPTGEPVPVVIAAPGFGGVKEMGLPALAERLAAIGIATLLFDYAGFGASAGEPRQHVDPWAQVDQYRSAIRHVTGLDGIDSARIGLCGVSLSGGHVLHLAATDAPVRCAVAIAPFVEMASGDAPPALLEAVVEDAIARADGHAPSTIPIVGRPGDLAVVTADGAWDWVEPQLAHLPGAENEVTLASLVEVSEYRPLDGLDRFRVPVRVVLATDDSVNPAETARRALTTVAGADVVELRADHFSVFDEQFDETATATATVAWFTDHLRP